MNTSLDTIERKNYLELPGNTELLRGATEDFVFTPEEEESIQSFVDTATKVILGEVQALPVMHQKDAWGERNEQVRDETLHRLGLNLGFDVEGSLNDSESRMLTEVRPFDKKLLGLDNPEKPATVDATVKTVYFSDRDNPARSFVVGEFEFDNHLVSPSGEITERKMRILGVYFGKDNDISNFPANVGVQTAEVPIQHA